MTGDIRRAFIQSIVLFRRMDLGELSRGCIPYGEMMVMGWVEERCPCGNLNVAELAQELNVSRPAVSQVLRTLEDKGYITRKADPADRRRILVVATHEGARALQQARTGYDSAVDRFLAHMPAEDLATLIQLMNRLNEVYAMLRKNESKGGAPK